MWQKTYSEVFKDVTKEEIWAAWTDVNHWHLWDNEIEWCKIETPFAVGSIFLLKPEGIKAVTITLVEVEPYKKYTDCTHFFGAKMYGMHEMSEEANGLRLTTTMSVRGPLGFYGEK